MNAKINYCSFLIFLLVGCASQMQSDEKVLLAKSEDERSAPVSHSLLAQLDAPLAFTEITKRMAAATVSVGVCDLSELQKGNLSAVSSRGTGFFINDQGLLLTARHVIPLPLSKNQAVILFQKNANDKSIYTTTTEIVYDWPDLDAVVLRVSEKASKMFKWLPLSEIEPMSGEDVGSFGYPLADLKMNSLERFDGSSIFSRVMRSTISNVESRALDPSNPKIKKKIVETQRAFSNGSSGGPLVSVKDGKVVGIVNGVFITPMGIEKIEVEKGKIIEVPMFAGYGNNMAILEIISRLQKSDYFENW